MMSNFNRRMFLATAVAAGGARLVPVAVRAPAAKRVLTLVYDKSIGAMRAVDKVVR